MTFDIHQNDTNLLRDMKIEHTKYKNIHHSFLEISCKQSYMF